MRILLATSAVIPHTGGLSTHFELLRGRLGPASMLAGCVTGGRRPAPARFREWAFAPFDPDLRRARGVDSTVRSLGAAIAVELTKEAVDVVHCHDVLAACAALSAVSEQGSRAVVIQTVHGPLSREALTGGARPGGPHATALRELERRAYGSCRRLLPVDSGQAAILAGDFGVEAERIAVIPNAVDAEEVARTAAGAASVPSVPYFVVPRRLVPKNGVEIALRALSRMPGRTHRLLLAGDGPLRSELHSLAGELGIGGRVCFLGDVDHTRLLPLMRRSRAVIVPSQPVAGVVEATSLAALEGMACGVPVIASAIGGLAEMIRPEETGFLFPAGDCESLMRLMARVDVLPDGERALLGQRAVSLVRSRYGVDGWFRRIARVYEEAACACVSAA